MAFTCNACGGCAKELNGQLQGLQSRVKTIERTISTEQTLRTIGLLKTIAAFIASGQAAAAALLSLDPQIALAILGAEAQEQLMAMIPGIDFTAILGQISIENLCLPALDDALVSAVADAIGDKLADAQQELEDAIANNLPLDQIADLQAKVACLGVSGGAAITFKNGQNRLSKCGTASAVLGLST